MLLKHALAAQLVNSNIKDASKVAHSVPVHLENATTRVQLSKPAQSPEIILANKEKYVNNLAQYNHDEANRLINQAYEDDFEGKTNNSKVMEHKNTRSSSPTKAKQTWAHKVEQHDQNKFHALHNVEDSEEEDFDNDSDVEDDELGGEDMDANKIYWFREIQEYAHRNGMQYDIINKNYMSRVTDNPEDSRCLYHLPFKGVLKLVRTVKRGDMNNKVLKDKDWDRYGIYTKKSLSHRLDLYLLFRERMIDRSSTSN